MRFKIKSRLDRSTKSTGKFGSWRQCVEAALNSGGGAVLRDADLHGAVLRGAALQGSDLQGADLRDAVLHGADLSSADLRDAVLQGADLSSADLSSAVLHGADLRDADLSSAVLRGADLSSADLSSAVLHGTDLRDAVLHGAVLHGADLRDANLRDANLLDADLSSADLRGAVLRGTDLSSADLTRIRDDFWAVLSGAPAEVPELIRALREGRVNGSQYEGECACLIGTIANARGCNYREIPTITPDAKRPAEAFFTAIRPGDTPEKNMAAKIAVEWAEDWLKRMREVFGGKQM